MKLGDYLWGGLLLLWAAVLVLPTTREVFMAMTQAYPYISGFFKFFVLATMGDMLGARILHGQWQKTKGLIFKAIIWGIIGMMITLAFTLYSEGVLAAQDIGRLPFHGSKFGHAFLTSVMMNITFAPFMFLFHKFSDLYIDVKYRGMKKVTINDLVKEVDFNMLIGFSMLKTIPFFWIPCHTIVFLMPPQYRVVASAFLSIALGLMMAIAKKSKKTIVNEQEVIG
ncbi:MAG: hypothetical protein E7215_02515 [Clostridium sulfidigenes]|uniref:Mpv17 / PMP22 family protein n=1 Tax=Clostridium sulfidigenes TaxID=318464 RepID=A0A927ZSM2_9CLOT|nr:hypothetical protein [Clostridium sulfidigenes]